MICEKTFVELSRNPLNVLNFGCEPSSSQSSRDPSSIAEATTNATETLQSSLGVQF